MFSNVFYIPPKGWAFSGFQENIALQRINGADFNLFGYQINDTCRDFINSYQLYNICLKARWGAAWNFELHRYSLLWLYREKPDGNSNLYRPRLAVANAQEFLFCFIWVTRHSQNKECNYCFKDSGLGDLIEKTVFTGSDGASVNCGKNIILVKQFQEDFPYICVIQCFSQIRKITWRIYQTSRCSIATSVLFVWEVAKIMQI